jgi:hypothetical protein
VASVTPSVTRWSLTSGVSPTRSTMVSAYFMPCSFLVSVRLGRRMRCATLKRGRLCQRRQHGMEELTDSD